jgi:hypothetical protein
MLRGIAVLVAGLLVGGLFAGLPATAAKKPLTKKKALKLFYTKAQSDARYLNQSQGDTLFLSQTEGDARYVSLSATDRGPSSETSITGDTTVNTVTLNAPTNGVFLIAGSASVDNDSGFVAPIELEYRLDTSGFVAAAEADINSEANMSDELQLAFTDAVAVTAGGHSVDMQIDLGGGINSLSYNLNNLSVTFVPQGVIT